MEIERIIEEWKKAKALCVGDAGDSAAIYLNAIQSILEKNNVDDLSGAQRQITRILSALEEKTGRLVNGVRINEDRAAGLQPIRTVEIELSCRPGKDYLI